MISSKSTHENVPKERSPDGDDIPDGTDSKTPKTTANQDDRKSFKCNLNVHLAYCMQYTAARFRAKINRINGR